MLFLFLSTLTPPSSLAAVAFFCMSVYSGDDDDVVVGVFYTRRSESERERERERG
jgi:hypothetical protein